MLPGSWRPRTTCCPETQRAVGPPSGASRVPAALVLKAVLFRLLPSLSVDAQAEHPAGLIQRLALELVLLLLRLDQTLDRGLNRRRPRLESPALDELIQARQRLLRKARREVLLGVAAGSHPQVPPPPLSIIVAARV